MELANQLLQKLKALFLLDKRLFIVLPVRQCYLPIGIIITSNCMYDDLKRGQGDNPTICLICLRKNS